jgi:hypothetical protein
MGEKSTIDCGSERRNSEKENTRIVSMNGSSAQRPFKKNLPEAKKRRKVTAVITPKMKNEISTKETRDVVRGFGPSSRTVEVFRRYL